MTIKLQVGGVYRDGNGNRVELIDEDDNYFRFTGDNGETYTDTGSYFGDEVSNDDLVEVVSEPEPKGIDPLIVEAAMCIWEFIWGEATDDFQGRYHALCGGEADGWAAVRCVTRDTVAPAVENAWKAAGLDACHEAGFHCFDWDFVPQYLTVMIAKNIAPEDLESRQNDILVEMGIIEAPKPKEKVIQIELDKVLTHEGPMYGVYKRVEESPDFRPGWHIEDFKIYSDARAKAYELAYEFKVNVVDSCATDYWRETDPVEDVA